jgi:hypothetical protein
MTILQHVIKLLREKYIWELHWTEWLIAERRTSNKFSSVNLEEFKYEK